MIKNVVFDLGGVIIHLNRDRSVRRFEKIGVSDAEELIDPYEQKGIFLELENGKINLAEFNDKIREHAGKDIADEDIRQAWLGFIVEVPEEKLDYIAELRKDYNMYLLSNTNPAVQSWAQSSAFSKAGKPLNDYFDKMYLSYEMGVTKPDPSIFEQMVADSGMNPAETLFVDDGEANIVVAQRMGFHTYMPKNAEDWRNAITELLKNNA